MQFLASLTANTTFESSVLRTKPAKVTVRYTGMRSVISPEKFGLVAAKIDPMNPQRKPRCLCFLSHNACDKVCPTELAKHTELRTKTAECNASP
ncbi:hypothetical protein C942_04054 [Photobacterium marinum]|uniref:Uncharacterized protein n=1 Tax=Photobacterium marinum TaxID=1056511 RepID=L8J4M1_9GAMM|nr:hypothetical protein C942_04054 [Photobacterium marinum]